MDLNIKSTKRGNHYCDGTGLFQEFIDRLGEALIPDSGKADTTEGEMLRIVIRLQHEYYNNGNMNIRIDNRDWNNLYHSLCELFRKCGMYGVLEDTLAKLRKLMDGGYRGYTCIFDVLLDHIAYYVIENKRELTANI